MSTFMLTLPPLVPSVRHVVSGARGQAGGRFKRRILGIVLLAVGALLLVTPAGGALSQLIDQAPPEGAEPAPGTDEPGGPSEPTLGAEREARALELIASDERAQPFLDGKDYEVVRTGPLTIDSPQAFEVFGAAVQLKLAERASYPQQEWPTTESAPALDPPYRERTESMAVDNVRQLMILVDLRRERVVRVEPLIDDMVKITPGPGYQIRPPTGE